jgi:hypothetical protein
LDFGGCDSGWVQPVRPARGADRVGEARVEPRVVDRDCRLVRERLRQSRVQLGEGSVALVDHLDDADGLVAHLQRHRDHVPRLELDRLVHDGVEARVVLGRVDDRCLAVVDDPAGNALVGGNLPARHLLSGLARRGRDAEIAALLLHEQERARLGVEELGGRGHDLLEQLVEVQGRVEEARDLDDPLQGGNLVVSVRVCHGLLL